MRRISEKQQEFTRRENRAILQKAEGYLEKAIRLKEQGKEDESNAVMADMRAWLEETVDQMEKEHDYLTKQFESEKDIPAEYANLPQSGEIVATGDKIILEVIKGEEKEKYIAVSKAHSFTKAMYEKEEFCESVWGDFISGDGFVCSIYTKDNGEYVGYCSIKNTAREEWELAMELLPEECHKGYGTEALKIFMDAVHKITGRRFFRARVAVDNHASQGLMRKLGATPNGISEYLLHGDEIKKFQEENKGMITDEIRNVADEFCMDAEDILGYVLEYRFDMQSK